MQVRLVLLFICTLVLCGCDQHSIGRQRIVVFAYDLCVVNQPMMSVETDYIEDSVAGKISYSKDLSVGFYVGRHPDFRGVVDEKVGASANPDIASVRYLRYREGYFEADVKIKGGQEREFIVFRSDSDLSENASFTSFLRNLRRCHLRERGQLGKSQ